ncbi:MAG: hypothetical protein WD468_12035 [Pirellulales bacterium]
MRSFCLLLILLAAALIGGCRGDRPDMATVSGQVLIDGQPLRLGVVQFVPKGSRASYGQLDRDGRFQLTCRDPNDGAVLGQHAVGISGAEIIESTNFVTKTRWHSPKQYADPNSSGLTADISGPVNDLTFNISWDGGKPFVETERSSPEPPEAGHRLNN